MSTSFTVSLFVQPTTSRYSSQEEVAQVYPLWTSNYDRVITNAIKRSKADPMGVYMVHPTENNNQVSIYRNARGSIGNFLHAYKNGAPIKAIATFPEIKDSGRYGRRTEEETQAIYAWQKSVLGQLEKLNEHSLVKVSVQRFEYAQLRGTEVSPPKWVSCVNSIIIPKYVVSDYAVSFYGIGYGQYEPANVLKITIQDDDMPMYFRFKKLMSSSDVSTFLNDTEEMYQKLLGKAQDQILPSIYVYSGRSVLEKVMGKTSVDAMAPVFADNLKGVQFLLNGEHEDVNLNSENREKLEQVSALLQQILEVLK